MFLGDSFERLFRSFRREMHHCCTGSLLSVCTCPLLHSTECFSCQLLCTKNCSLVKYHWWIISDQRHSKVCETFHSVNLSQWTPFTFAPCLQYLSTPLRIHIMKHPLGSPGLDLNKWDEWFRFRLLLGPFFFVPKGRVVLQRSLHPRCLRQKCNHPPRIFWDKNPSPSPP